MNLDKSPNLRTLLFFKSSPFNKTLNTRLQKSCLLIKTNWCYHRTMKNGKTTLARRLTPPYKRRMPWFRLWWMKRPSLHKSSSRTKRTYRKRTFFFRR